MRKDVYIVARKKVASEPVLRDWTAVDVALRDLKECQYALTELGVELDRRIDGLKDDYNKNAQAGPFSRAWTNIRPTSRKSARTIPHEKTTKRTLTPCAER